MSAARIKRPSLIPPRVARLRAAADKAMLDPDGRRILRFVFDADEHLRKEQLRLASYRETEGLPTILRRAEAFARICREWDTPIRADELIVGSQRGNIWWRGEGSPVTPEQEEQHRRIQDAWGELGIAFGEGHVVCDYERILREGLRAQVERIEALSAAAAPDDERQTTWQAMKLTCAAVRDFALRYAQAAREAAQQASVRRGRELRKIAAICERVPWEPARTFREALQSFWFVHLALHIESPSVAVSPGRMDQYLWPYCEADMEAGRLTPAQVEEALACLWLKFWEGEESQNVTIGGMDAEGQDATNPLSVLMVELTRVLRAFQPSLSVRAHENMPTPLLHAGLTLAQQGFGQPSFFSDETVTAALRSIGVPEEEAWDWAIVGCYEAVVAGAEWGRTVAGGVHLPHCVLAALKRRPPNFCALLQATREELAAGIDRAVEAANAHERHEAEHAPSPFQSVLMRDCIERGRDIYRGGARHNYSACWLSGLATGVDSVAAVRRLVYRERALTLEQLCHLLETDFEGAEETRRMLLTRAPKFGNDLPEADDLARVLCRSFCEEVTRRRNPRGGIFQPSLAMYQQHYAGMDTGATPDGRRAGTPFSAGVGPSPGCNERGVTATLASCAKIPHDRAPNGNFLIVSLPPEIVESLVGVVRLGILIATYFDLGGSHVMFNIVDAETLRDAQKHPERHRDLMVRISGLSAHFVTLAPHIQDDIIARTQRGL